MRVGGLLAGALALVVAACTPSPSASASAPESGSATASASASAPAPVASAASRGDDIDRCHTDADCPPRVVTMNDGRSTSIARVCCLQPAMEGTPAHLDCQDANSKRACVVGCRTDADCHGTLKCKPWGDTNRTACQ